MFNITEVSWTWMGGSNVIYNKSESTIPIPSESS